MTKMGDDQYGRRPDQNGRQPNWKMTKMEEQQN